VIADYIENIMEKLSENSEDVYLYKEYFKEIQDLREKEIIYSIEIRKIEKALANQ
jgi:predicted DNA-binding protein